MKSFSKYLFTGFFCWISLFQLTAVPLKADSLNGIVNITDDIRLLKIKENIWIHTTFIDYPKWGKIPANGLLVTDGSVAALVDTPWTNQQTNTLIDWVEKSLRVKVIQVVATHSHDDCMGGLEAVHNRGITSYALDITQNITRQKALPIPMKTFSEKMVLKLGELDLVLHYPGGGHTVDNIVVWLPGQKVLFGGCLIKSVRSKKLGNTKDADMASWLPTLKKVRKTFSTAEIVVPGHGQHGDVELIDHTIKLCEDYFARN